jgi:murein DD-endopeptidase MepM/ murein hydrolase activator NlpD
VAQFTNDGKSYEAAWFQEPGTRGAYFDLDGRSTRRAFLASPVEFSRVTSGFAMRLHPIHQTWRRHLGVDLAAPNGTPVRTVGDGTVEFAGVQNGYGKVVFVKHSGDRETVYAHLSRIGVRQGQRVSQGDLIGAVGATGWATGPHLHFEVRKNGSQLDPLQAARSSEGHTLSPAARTQFQAQALVWRSQLAAAAGYQQFARAE